MNLDASNNMVYSCRFELYIQELHIVMKFPCQIFVEWKNSSLSKKSIPIVKPAQIKNGIANFRDSITVEAELIFNEQRHCFVKKQTFLMVNLITNSRPDQPKLVGRIVIDLAQVINNKRYQEVLPRQLQYCSVQASLLFNIHLIQKKLVDKNPNQIDRDTISDLISFDNRQSRYSIFGMKPSHNIVQQYQRQAFVEGNNRDKLAKKPLKSGKNDFTPIKDFYKNGDQSSQQKNSHNFGSIAINSVNRYNPKEQYRSKSHISGGFMEQHKSHYQFSKNYRGIESEIPFIYKDRKKTEMVVAQTQKAKAQANQIEEQIKKLSEQLQERQRNFGRQRQRQKKIEKRTENYVENPLKKELQVNELNLKSEQIKRKILQQQSQKLQNNYASNNVSFNDFKFQQLQKQKIHLNEQLREQRQKRRQLEKKLLTQKNATDNSNQKRIANSLKQFEKIKKQLQQQLTNEKTKRRKAQSNLEQFQAQYKQIQKVYQDISKKSELQLVQNNKEITEFKEQIEKLTHLLQSQKSLKKSLEEAFQQKEEEYLAKLQSFQQQLKATKKHLVNQLNETLQKVKQISQQNQQLKLNRDELLSLKSELKIKLQTQIQGKKKLLQILEETKNKSNSIHNETENHQKLKDRIAGLQDCMDRMQENLDMQRQSKLSIYQKYEQIQIENDAKEEIIRDLQEQLKFSHQSIQQLNQNLQNSYLKHKDQIISLKAKHSQIFQSYEKQIRQLREKNQALKLQVQEAKKQESQAKKKEKVEEHSTIADLLKQTQNNLKMYEQEIQRLNTRIENIQQENKYLIKSIDEKEEIIKQLRDQKSLQKLSEKISQDNVKLGIAQQQSQILQQFVVERKKFQPLQNKIQQQQVVETIEFYPQSKSYQVIQNNCFPGNNLNSSQKRRNKIEAEMAQVAQSFDMEIKPISGQNTSEIKNENVLQIMQKPVQNQQIIDQNLSKQNKQQFKLQNQQPNLCNQEQIFKGTGKNEQEISQYDKITDQKLKIDDKIKTELQIGQKEQISRHQQINEYSTQNQKLEHLNFNQEQNKNDQPVWPNQIIQQARSAQRQTIQQQCVQQVIDIYPSNNFQSIERAGFEQNNKDESIVEQIDSNLIPQIVINLVNDHIPEQQNLQLQQQPTKTQQYTPIIHENQEINNFEKQSTKIQQYTPIIHENQELNNFEQENNVNEHIDNVSSPQQILIKEQDIKAIIAEKQYLRKILEEVKNEKKQMEDFVVKLQTNYNEKNNQLLESTAKICELQSSKLEIEKFSQQNANLLSEQTNNLEALKKTHIPRTELEKQMANNQLLREQLQILKRQIQTVQSARKQLISALQQAIPEKLAIQQQLNNANKQKQQLIKTVQKKAQMLQKNNEQLIKINNLLLQSKQNLERQTNKIKDLQSTLLKFQQKQLLLRRNLQVLEEQSRKIFESVKTKQQNQDYLNQMLNFKDQCINQLEQQKHSLQTLYQQQKSTLKNNINKIANLQHENNKLLKKIQNMETMQNSLVSGQSYRQEVLRNKNKQIHDLNIQLNQKAKQKLQDQEQIKKHFKIKEQQLLRTIQELENKIKGQKMQEYRDMPNQVVDDELNDQINQLKIKISGKQREKANIQSQLSLIKSKLENDNYLLQNANTRLSQQVNDLQLQNMQSSKTHEQLDNRAQELQVVIEQLEDDNRRLKVQLETARINNISLLQQQRRLEARMINLQIKLKQQMAKTSSLLKSQQNLQAKLTSLPSSNTQKDSLVNDILKEKAKVIEQMRKQIQKKDKQLQEITKLKNQIIIFQSENQRLQEENFIHQSEKNERDVIVDELRAENVTIREILNSLKNNFDRRVQEQVRRQYPNSSRQIQPQGSRSSSPSKTIKLASQNGNKSIINNKVVKQLSIILEQRSSQHLNAVRDLLRQKEKLLKESQINNNETLLKKQTKKISEQFQKFKNQLLKSQMAIREKTNIIALTRNYEKIVNQFIYSCQSLNSCKN